MGGLAFASDGLSTPRMPPNLYSAVLERAEAILKIHFKLVGHALEAPAKTSHGDVDILVSEPVKAPMPSGQPMGDLLTKLLGAKTWKRTSGSSTYNLALPWPEEFKNDVPESECQDGTEGHRGTIYDQERPEPGMMNSASAQSTSEEITDTSVSARLSNLKITSSCKPMPLLEKYIQVDVNVLPDAADFNWHMFSHAHGDLWSMMGGIIRRFGLTASSKGFCVRIAEVEKHNKEQSRVLATSDPDTILDYIGLDKQRYWKPFKDWDEMLDYVATCRFHNPAQWKVQNQSEEDAKKGVQDADQKLTEKLPKANDRQRAAKRPLFGYWIETYLPAHVDDEPGSSAFLTRVDTVADAKQFFGPEYAQKFEERKRKMVRQIGVDKLWADIRKSLPVECTEIGYVMKGMKREIVGHHSGTSPGVSVEGLESTKAAFDECRFDDVLEWAQINWKQVGERQKQIDQAQSSANLQEKRKKDALKAKEKMDDNGTGET